MPLLTGGAPVKYCPDVKCARCRLCFCGHFLEVFSQIPWSQLGFILECIIQAWGLLFPLLLLLDFFLSLSPLLSSSLHPLILFFFSSLGPSHVTFFSMRVKRKRENRQTQNHLDKRLEETFKIKCWAYNRNSEKLLIIG